MNKIPCFLIARDRLTCLKNMVDYLNAIPEMEIIIIDNESTYQPLLDWYDTKPCIIERLVSNYGNFVLFNSPTVIEGHIKPNFQEKYGLIGRQYILSDCDLDLSGVPKDFLSVLQEGLRRYTWAIKCGLSLEINNLPSTEIAAEAIGWEGSNWTNALDDSYYKAAVDTTFALLTGVGEQNDFARCLRTARPYTASHLTWTYSADNPPPEDEIYY